MVKTKKTRSNNWFVNPKRGYLIIQLCVALYAIYGAFVMIETLDFLKMLHTNPPGYSPTYDIVNVAFYMIEMVICIALALGFYALMLKAKSWDHTYFILGVLTLFRLATAYWLYIFQEDYQLTTFIYKKANFLSYFRLLFVPLQILMSIIATYWWLHFIIKKTSYSNHSINQ